MTKHNKSRQEAEEKFKGFKDEFVRRMDERCATPPLDRPPFTERDVLTDLEEEVLDFGNYARMLFVKLKFFRDKLKLECRDDSSKQD